MAKNFAELHSSKSIELFLTKKGNTYCLWKWKAVPTFLYAHTKEGKRMILRREETLKKSKFEWVADSRRETLKKLKFEWVAEWQTDEERH